MSGFQNRNKGMYMRLQASFICAALSTLLWSCSDHLEGVGNPSLPEQSVSATQPNILLIVADDLGYSDIGAFGGEIETPFLDELAAQGVSFTNFHVTPACATTRASLLTGVDHHLTGIGAFPNFASPNQIGRPGYEGFLNDHVVTIAEALKANNYATFMVGKWHLSSKKMGEPHTRGFDRAWDFSAGIQDHFALTAKAIENGVVQEEYPADFYASNYMTDKLIGYLEGSRDTNKPFFAYLAFTAPHFALQAPDNVIDKYAGRYDAGYEAIADERLQRMIERGLVSENTKRAPITPKNTAWDTLSEEQQKFNARAMELYAAMVDNMDHNIGRVVDYLQTIEQYDNSLIIFISDNGAASVGMDTNLLKMVTERMDRNLKKRGEPGIDNSYENMGQGNSRIAYGSGWAGVGSTPQRHFKHTTSEGGLLVPAIFSGGLLQGKGQISHSFATGMDIMPTILDLTSTEYPKLTRAGIPAVPLAGTSLMPAFSDPEAQIHPDDYVMGWELNGDLAIYQNGWKLLSLLPPMGDGEWELYYLPEDPTEQTNLAAAEPEKLAAMQRAWRDYSKDKGVVIAQKDLNLVKMFISSDPEKLSIARKQLIKNMSN